MPVYKYKCRKCEVKFEMLQDIGATNEGITCPKCGAPWPIKQISVFSSSDSAENSECVSDVSSTGNIHPD